MDKKTNSNPKIDPSREIIKALLLQKAGDKAISLRWNKYSLLFIFSTLLVVLILVFNNVNLTIVSIVAALGLAAFWIFATWQGKNLEKRFFEQEKTYYEALFPEDRSKTLEMDISSNQASPLSKREMEVMKHIVQGNTNKQIAQELDITDQTVKNHITNILKKMNVSDRTSAAVMALHRGWIRHNQEGQIEISDFAAEDKANEVRKRR
jgi:DNA-binding CsgD family transcriptional regulator